MAEIEDVDIITSSFGQAILIGPLKNPTDPTDPATKAYVDAHTGGVPIFVSPLNYDGGINTVTITDADDTHSGVITAGVQTIGGDKTFTGQTTVLTPVSDFQPSTKKYVDDTLGAISALAPISFAGNVISMPPANGAASGYLTGAGTQTIGGDKILTGIVTVPTPTGLSGNTQAANKGYVNSQIGAISGTVPITVSSGVVSITAANGATGGYITGAGSQTIGGNKDFTGTVTSITPTAAAQVAIKSYVDGAITGLSGTAPISVSSGVVSMTAASSGVAGYVTAGAQTISGDKTLTGVTKARGLNYATCNGWISGGIITPVIGGTTFSVSATTCRFTDYTSESDPVASVVVILPQVLNITSLHTGSTDVGIYIDSTGAIIQDTTAINIPLLYGNMISLGRLVHENGTIKGASNSKYPVADRYDLVSADFINNIAPLNLGKFLVGQSTHAPPDLSIGIGSGTVWEQMSNITASRTSPSIKTVSPVDQPEFVGFWQDNTGVQQALLIPPTQLDTGFYNPGATGAALVAIPATYWVNIPILYNAAADYYAFQYPTSAYTTAAYATASVGKFIHLDPLKLFIVIGFVTVQAGATDLTAAIFGTGEFFNYSVASAAAITNTNPSESFESNTAWVDYVYGDDANGQVAFMSKPYKTFDAAAAALAANGAADANPQLVHGVAGPHQDATIELRPYVNFGTWCPGASVWEVTGPGNNVTLHSSFNGAAAGDTMTTIHNVKFEDTGLNLRFDLIGGVGTREIDFNGCFVGDSTVFTANTVDDIIKLMNCDFETNATYDGGVLLMFTVEHDLGSTLSISATNIAQTSIISGLTCDNMTVTATTGHNANVTLANSFINGTLTVNGANVTLRINRGSVPINPIVVQNSAVVIVYDDLLDANDIAGVQNSLTPLSAANYVIDKATFTSGLGGKVSTATTVNGHALSANVTVGFPDIAGQIAHGQLCALFSGDIPANAANTSGTAANFTVGSTPIVPNGTMAITQADGDNTQKLATTAYLDRLRGAANGIAELDGSGYVPVGQINVASLGALTYQGTWSLNSYPTATAAGQFWIVDTDITLGPPISGDLHSGDWLIWNGGTWDSVSNTDVISYLATWPGSTNLITLGVITTGTWNGNPVDSTHGGTYGVTGILKSDGLGTVTAATHALATDDYVAPSDSTTISGVKTFSNGAHSAAPPVADSSTLVATTAFVQSTANIPQVKVKYVSAVGTDAPPNDGTTMNLAVASIQYAASLCTAPSITSQYAVCCFDAAYDPLGSVVMPSFVNLHAPIKFLTGTNIFSDSSHINIKRFDTPLPGGSYPDCCVVYSGGSGSGYSFVRAQRIYHGAIWVDSNQYIRTLDVGIIDHTSPSTPVITCNGPNSTLYVQSTKITGLISAIGNGAVIDLSLVGDLSQATFYTQPLTTARIIYPPQGAGNVTGILLGNGQGSITVATPAVDYMAPSSTITLTTDVAGSGPSTGIPTTIQPGAVTLAKMANMTANTVIANPTGVAATGQYLSLASTAANTSVVLRDSNANTAANHWTEGIFTQAANGGNKVLSVTDPTVQEFTGNGTLSQTVTLPVATALLKGFKFKIINNNSAVILNSTPNMTINYQDSTLAVALQMGMACELILTDSTTGAGNGTWSKSSTNNLMQLTGPITAFGRGSVTTTITANAVTLANLEQKTGPSVVAYTVAGPANATTLTYDPAKSASTLVQRDASSNVVANNCVSSLESHSTSPTALHSYSPQVQVFTGPTQTVVLPSCTLNSPPDLPLVVGFRFRIINDTATALTVQTFGGATIYTVNASGQVQVFCKDMSSPAGVWEVVTNSLITLSGNVTGSGNTAITTTISSGVVTFGVGGMLASSLNSGNVLGNVSGLTGEPRAVSVTSTPGTNTVVLRDATTGSVFVNHASEGYNATHVSNILSPSDAPIQEFTGTSTYTVFLPDPGTIGGYTGFKYTLINNNTGVLTVRDSSNNVVATLPVGAVADFTARALVDPNAWVVTQLSKELVTLTGNVTGAATTGSPLSIATTVASLPNGVVTLASMANMASGNLLGNVSGSSVAPALVPVDTTSSSTASNVMRRDASSNVYVNNVVKGYTLNLTPPTIVVGSSPILQWSGGNTLLVTLPNTTTLNQPGFTYTLINSNIGLMTVQASGGAGTVATIPANTAANFTAVSILSNAVASWAVVPNAQITTLGGNLTGTSTVSGTGTQTLNATIASIPAGVVSVGSLSSVAANTVLANATLASAVPTAYVVTTGNLVGNQSGTLGSVPFTSANTSSAVVARDSNGNVLVNSVAEVLNSPGAAINLTIASNPIQYYNAGTFTVTLPDVTTGFTVGKSYTVVNDGTGIITVANGAASTLIKLSQWMRCKFVLTAGGTAAGVWELVSSSMMAPQRLFTNVFAQALTSTTLTAAQMYNGPIQCTNANTTLTLPSYTTLIGNVSTATSLMGILGYMPPNGFNFTSLFVPGSTTVRVTVNIGGSTGVAYLAPAGTSINGANGALMLLHVVLDTVNSQYRAITGVYN